mgnify:CR=1 FL=1
MLVVAVFAKKVKSSTPTPKIFKTTLEHLLHVRVKSGIAIQRYSYVLTL